MLSHSDNDRAHTRAIMSGMNTPPTQQTPKLGTTSQRWTAASINFLTQDEMRGLLDAIDSKHDYAIFLLAYHPAWGSAPWLAQSLLWSPIRRGSIDRVVRRGQALLGLRSFSWGRQRVREGMHAILPTREALDRGPFSRPALLSLAFQPRTPANPLLFLPLRDGGACHTCRLDYANGGRRGGTTKEIRG
jgi:hypothetical protein